jgi:hypothetical protein
VTILLTQVAVEDPTPASLLRDLWRLAADG